MLINIASCLIYSFLIKPDLVQLTLTSNVDKPLFRVFYFMKPNDNYEIKNVDEVKYNLQNKSTRNDNGCWIWKRDAVKGGYERYVNNGRKWLAHRISYIVFKGKIPEDYTIDHLCKTTNCINPEHLEAVTMKENTHRGTSFSSINANKTHCPKGHEYSIENTFRYKNNGRRDCKICMRERSLRYYNEKKKKNEKP